MSKAPTGIGTYARQLSEKTHGTPAEFAKNHKDNGFTFAAFMACWQDMQGEGGKFRQFGGGSLGTTTKYVEACLKADVKIWLWGFPWIGHEEAYMDAMVSMAKLLPESAIEGFLHDPEVSYRDKNAKLGSEESRGQGEATEGFVAVANASEIEVRAKKLMALDREAVAELKLRPSGITSYGMSDWHALPWEIFADGGRTWGSPQLYTVTPKQVDMGLKSWAKYKFDGLVPSIPAYGKNSGANLDAHLSNFVNGTAPPIDGFIVWSYPQIDGVEWGILKKWAAMLKTGVCGG